MQCFKEDYGSKTYYGMLRGRIEGGKREASNQGELSMGNGERNK